MPVKEDMRIYSLFWHKSEEETSYYSLTILVLGNKNTCTSLLGKHVNPYIIILVMSYEWPLVS